jgi:hypothetical protein
VPLLITKGYGTPGSVTPPDCVVFYVTGVAPGLNYIDIFFSTDLTASGPAVDPNEYTITPLDGGGAQTVTEVTVGTNYIRLTTTEHKDGALYSVTMPVAGYLSTGDGGQFQGPFTNEYTGVGLEPGLIMVRVIDARTIDVHFNEAVMESDATDPENYTITPLLEVVSIAKVTSSVYRITTSRQVEDTAYTITSHDIRDLRGNQDT